MGSLKIFSSKIRLYTLRNVYIATPVTDTMKDTSQSNQILVPKIWPRSDPEELAKFDPRTKHCTMNCGPSTLDPRSKKERLFQCTDCYIQTRHITVIPVQPPIPTRCFDYKAQYTDSPETGPFGWGPTPEDAITDLQNQDA